MNGYIAAVMFLRRIERRKNGETHLYWGIVENKRLDGGRRPDSPPQLWTNPLGVVKTF